jgi:hypothetical protein
LFRDLLFNIGLHYQRSFHEVEYHHFQHMAFFNLDNDLFVKPGIVPPPVPPPGLSAIIRMGAMAPPGLMPLPS